MRWILYNVSCILSSALALRNTTVRPEYLIPASTTNFSSLWRILFTLNRTSSEIGFMTTEGEVKHQLLDSVCANMLYNAVAEVDKLV